MNFETSEALNELQYATRKYKEVFEIINKYKAFINVSNSSSGEIITATINYKKSADADDDTYTTLVKIIVAQHELEKLREKTSELKNKLQIM